MADKRYKTEQSWLTAAVKGIRFKPDRVEVERELREHIEDKMADLRRLYPDLAQEEAEELALDRMGDPEEIGRELAKVHRPWLGYLWRASQAVLAALALLLVIGLVWGNAGKKLETAANIWSENREYQVITRMLYGNGTAAELSEQSRSWWDGQERLALYDLNREVRLGEATLTLSQAALWQKENGRYLYLQIRLEYDRPRDRSNVPTWYLQAEDNLGSHYGHRLEIQGTGTSMSGLGYFGKKTGWRADTWNFFIDNLPEEAEWVRVFYALRPDADLGLTVMLREEGTW